MMAFRTRAQNNLEGGAERQLKYITPEGSNYILSDFAPSILLFTLYLVYAMKPSA